MVKLLIQMKSGCIGVGNNEPLPKCDICKTMFKSKKCISYNELKGLELITKRNHLETKANSIKEWLDC